MSGRGTDLFVFPHDCEDLNDLTNINIAAASNPAFDSGPRHTTSDSGSDQQPEESPEEPRMIGDFDGSSNALWTLYRDEAKSHDDARINTLKDDMESALIFVCSYPICTMDSVVLKCGLTGRFIFRCPHYIRTR
jgi:hypothetical protein